MKVLAIFIICGLMTLPTTARSATLPRPAHSTIYPQEEILKKFTSLKIKEVQKLIGRKLTIKEKISFLILKATSKKKDKTNQGATALGFGIVALATLVIGLFVPYVIIVALVASILAIVLGSMAKKQDPSDKKAHGGLILGWITLALIALFLIVAAIVVASWA